MYTAGLSNDELWTRYDSCQDMARQLSAYVSRKMSEVSWSLDETLGRVEQSVIRKVNDGSWEYSFAEVRWIMKRTRELLSSSSEGKAT